MQRERIVSVLLTLGLAVGGCGGGTTEPDAASSMPDAFEAADAGTQDDAFAPPDAAETPDAYTPPIYVGLVPDQTLPWMAHAGSVLGLDAGHILCQEMVGADHVCDYLEVVAAEERGELSGIAMGTTAWLQRTTTVTVDGVESPAGAGGNCNDWRFNGNHLADGEYVTFDAAGVPTYHFDADTFFDGADVTHAASGILPCGGETRAILCCAAAP